jgi:hypothetical protein
MKRLFKGLLPLGFVSALATTTIIAQPIAIDEFGHMTANGVLSLPGALGPDPTGGLVGWNVLIYTLPFAGLQGDVLVQDAFEPGSPILDVLRFDGQSHLIFYSDSIGGFSSLADTPGPPDPFLPNQAFLNEQIINAQFSIAFYAPTPNQPGWAPSNPTYQFASEGIIPEPNAATIVSFGLGAFGLARIGRNRIGGRRREK